MSEKVGVMSIHQACNLSYKFQGVYCPWKQATLCSVARHIPRHFKNPFWRERRQLSSQQQICCKQLRGQQRVRWCLFPLLILAVAIVMIMLHIHLMVTTGAGPKRDSKKMQSLPRGYFELNVFNPFSQSSGACCGYVMWPLPAWLDSCR